MAALMEAGQTSNAGPDLRPFILVRPQDGGEPTAVTVPDGYLDARAAALADPAATAHQLFGADVLTDDPALLMEMHVSRVQDQAEGIVRGRELERTRHGIGELSFAEMLSGQSGGAAAPTDDRWVRAGRRHAREVVATREHILAQERAAIITGIRRARNRDADTLPPESIPTVRHAATTLGHQVRLQTADVRHEPVTLRFADQLSSTTTSATAQAPAQEANSRLGENDTASVRARVARAARRAGNFAVYAGLTGLTAYLVPQGIRDMRTGATCRGTTYLDPVNGGPIVTGSNVDAVRHPGNYQIDVHHTAQSVIDAASHFGKGSYEVMGPIALIIAYAIGRSVVKHRPMRDERPTLRESLRFLPAMEHREARHAALHDKGSWREAVRVFPAERGTVRSALYSLRQSAKRALMPGHRSSQQST